MVTRWIWCETIPPREVIRPRPLELLRRYQLRPLIAVRPPDLEALPEVASAFREQQLPFGFWPMLDDAAGRWGNASNLDAYLGLCDAVLARCSAALPSVLAFDLEPPIELIRPLTLGQLPSAPRGRPLIEPTRDRLAAYVAALHGRGIGSLAAAVPLVLHERAGTTGFQRGLGTPISGVGFQHVSAMVYTSLIEGWSRRALSRDDARALLSTWAQRAARLGFGLSLGAVGLGAFGNEPRFRTPAELREDVTLALAMGIEQLALLDLGGVLTREPAEAWLEAFAAEETHRGPLPSSLKIRALCVALDAAASVLA